MLEAFVFVFANQKGRTFISIWIRGFGGRWSFGASSSFYVRPFVSALQNRKRSKKVYAFISFWIRWPFLCLQNRNRTNVFISLGSGTLLEAKPKLELASGLLEPAVACKRECQISRFHVWSLLLRCLQNRNRTKSLRLTLPRSGDLLFLCLQSRTFGIRCCAGGQAGDCSCFCIGNIKRTKAGAFVSSWVRCFGGVLATLIEEHPFTLLDS